MTPHQLDSDGDDMLPATIPLAERVGKLREALLLTAGYYAGRLPVVRELIRRLD